MMRFPNRLKIDLSSLLYNLNQVKKLVGDQTAIMGIVKSDAYGHGLLPVSQILEKNGVHSLGVAHIHEALILREKGIRLPIVVLCGIRNHEDAVAVVENDLTMVIFDMESTKLLSREASLRRKKVNIHLKIDTGMGRLGISHEDAVSFIKKITEYKGIRIEGLMSHLSSADESERGFTEGQIELFKGVIGKVRDMGLKIPLNHMANSAGIMGYKESHFNLVRPGIMLYGGLPSPDFNPPLPLKQVMEFSGEVIQVRDLPDNTPISYGRQYRTKGSKKVAILSAGYGDGLNRSFSNRGKVLIGGKKADIIGTVCMNMIACDITEIENILPGDNAVFLGSQGDNNITGDDMARWTDTISYEIFLSIGTKASREYRE